MSDSTNESTADGEPDVQASNDGTAALGEDHRADAIPDAVGAGTQTDADTATGTDAHTNADSDITDGSLPTDADLQADPDN